MQDIFSELIENITACNKALYQSHNDDEQWQDSLDLMQKRALFLQNLSSILNTLNHEQVNIVGQLYQSMLDSDASYLQMAELERKQTRDALRAIKNAEIKALPAYKAHFTS